MREAPRLSREVSEEVQRRIEWVESLVEMREEPEEIEHDVRALGERLAALFEGWLRLKGLREEASLYASLVPLYTAYVYLAFYPRRTSFAKIPNRALAELFDALSADPLSPPSLRADLGLSLRLFYQFLGEAGYQCRAARIQGVLQNLCYNRGS